MSNDDCHEVWVIVNLTIGGWGDVHYTLLAGSGFYRSQQAACDAVEKLKRDRLTRNLTNELTQAICLAEGK